MSDLSAAPASWKRFLSPWRITAAILTVFLGVQGYLYWQDRSIRRALESDPSFATPVFALRFSRRMPYDPITFLGRGSKSGLWRYTRDGLELTDEGQRFFQQEDDYFMSTAPAGRRRVRRISSIERRDEGASQVFITFFYEWAELSPAAGSLPFPPPRLGQEYFASATLERGPEGWKVQSLEARDFDEAMARLQDVASGVRR